MREVIDDRNVGVNPKINNLIAPFEQAKYDLIWVLDSTISMHPGSLGRALDAFLGNLSSSTSMSSFEHDDLESTPLMSDDVRSSPVRGDVGLVHHVPYAIVHQRTLGSLVEQAFLNTTHAKMYLAIVSVSQAVTRAL
jgi:ceramide glucosyltransferase